MYIVSLDKGNVQKTARFENPMNMHSAKNRQKQKKRYKDHRATMSRMIAENQKRTRTHAYRHTLTHTRLDI